MTIAPNMCSPASPAEWRAKAQASRHESGAIPATRLALHNHFCRSSLKNRKSVLSCSNRLMGTAKISR